MNKRTNRIVIVGGDSDFNLGDTAILSSLCHCLYTADTKLKLTIASNRMNRSELPGVDEIVRRGPAGFAKLVRVVKRSDLVIVGGGGLFQDDDSRIKMPYWASKLALLRLANANIVGHCLGAGPLRHAESHLFASIACSTMQSVSVRDNFAFRALSPCTVKPVHIVPDPAFMLPPAPRHEARELISKMGILGDKPIIGVAIRRWFHKLGGFVPHRVRVATGMDKQSGLVKMEQFLEQLAAALRHLSQRLQASILLLPTYNVPHEGDAAMCRRLAAKLQGVAVSMTEILDPRLYKAVTGELTLMVAARMHPLILAAGMGTPIVGLAYNGKFDGMFDMLNLEHRPLWLNDDLGSDQLVERMEMLASQAMAQRTSMTHRATELSATVARSTLELLRATR